MRNISVYIQYLIPKHVLTALVGYFAYHKNKWLRTLIISRFIKRYQVNLSEAQLKDIDAFESFNDFFTRRLQPGIRPIAQSELICPVDGMIAQVGFTRSGKLLQAKGLYYDLCHLLGKDEKWAKFFENGPFVTFYLAPRDYHRVHMPCEGTLLMEKFIPGKLFSVNRLSSSIIPNLYGRNERLVTIFSTNIGKVAIILVGAMIVGSISTVWHPQPYRQTWMSMPTDAVKLKKGDELGRFHLGSTVIVLFEKDRVKLADRIMPDTPCLFGEALGQTLAPTLSSKGD